MIVRRTGKREFFNAQIYNTSAVFGNGNDTVTLNNPGAVLTGTIQGGNGTNTFNQVSGMIAPTFQLINF
jgi:hypothetical protein